MKVVVIVTDVGRITRGHLLENGKLLEYFL